MGRPNKSCMFLVFSGFGNLLEYFDPVFTCFNRFFIYGLVFLGFPFSVSVFFCFSNLNGIFKIELFSKIEQFSFLNIFKFEQF
jgi:hypothetical protein